MNEMDDALSISGAEKTHGRGGPRLAQARGRRPERGGREGLRSGGQEEKGGRGEGSFKEPQ